MMSTAAVPPEVTDPTSVQVPPAGGVMVTVEPPSTSTCARSWSYCAVPAGTLRVRLVAAAPAVCGVVGAREGGASCAVPAGTLRVRLVAAAPAVLALVAAWKVPDACAGGVQVSSTPEASRTTAQAPVAKRPPSMGGRKRTRLTGSHA